MKAVVLQGGNKYLDKKWKQKAFEEHQKRIKDMKSDFNQGNFKPIYKIDPKLRAQKKEAEQESRYCKDDKVIGRYTEIERENRILLNKMSNIMRSTNSNFPSKIIKF
jgi:ATP-dependent Clp protease ATP-binding subunit ClpA